MNSQIDALQILIPFAIAVNEVIHLRSITPLSWKVAASCFYISTHVSVLEIGIWLIERQRQLKLYLNIYLLSAHDLFIRINGGCVTIWII